MPSNLFITYPPNPERCGSAIELHKAVVIAASTALPPIWSTSIPY